MASNGFSTNSISNDSNSSVDEHVFKKPQVILKNTLETKPEKNVPESGKIIPIPLSDVYNEPVWSGLPVGKYYFEEVKEGQVVRKIDLTQKPFTVIGRCLACDVNFIHPTVSRYHAILQYRKVADENEPAGFYLYDVGSTHNTFVNKKRIPVKTYYKLKVGSHIKIGLSTRTLIFNGPDEEPESEMTWSQMKQKHLDMTLEEDNKKNKLKIEVKEQLKNEEEDGINWGMAEDADEETDLSENPFAATLNEELYINDPKKTLSGWFEREGEELEYKLEEKGFGHFLCQVELPVEIGGRSKLIAEANVKGKKKEAVIQCALEACRLLDRRGLLRQANQEPRKPAVKDWEAEDFYDSDEDNFLDRTGDVEKKRTKRMAKFGKLNSTPENYDSLVKKYDECGQLLNEAVIKLREMKSPASHFKYNPDDDNEDELADFMYRLVNSTPDHAKIKELQEQIATLERETNRLEKLMDIVRPIKPHHTATLGNVRRNLFSKESDLNLNLDEGDSDNEEGKKELERCKERTEQKVEGSGKSTRVKYPEAGSASTSKQQQDKQNLQVASTSKQQQYKQNLQVASTSKHQQDKQNLQVASTSKQQDKQNLQVLGEPVKKRSKITNAQKKKIKAEPVNTEEDYRDSTWIPPPGQTGDGRTHLNDKLGY